MTPAWRSPTVFFACALLAIHAATPRPAFAWGDEGHEIIGLIAEHYLNPIARAKVILLLAGDADTLTEHDVASEATWADKYRDSDRDTTKIRYQATRQWHFVNIELAESNLASACFGHQPLAPDVAASMGPPRACVVDEIDQFAAELANPATAASERLLALKFLLHFVGDLHQPLHAADDHDAGGNKKLATASGLRSGNLDRYWEYRVRRAAGDRPTSKCRQSDRADFRSATAGVVERNIGGLGHGSLRSCSKRRLRIIAATGRSRRVFAAASLRGSSRERRRGSAEPGRGSAGARTEPSPLCSAVITGPQVAQHQRSLIGKMGCFRLAELCA